jgi:chemotaxis protein methyltransferase CheR
MTEAWSSPELERIARLVARRTGIVTSRSHADLERAARDVVKLVGLRNVNELADRLAAGALWEELIDQITVRETYFFRSPEHFELMRSRILPALSRERPPSHHLRVWSAGCASGEEPYTLAIVLDQCGLLQDSTVLGTDLSQQALAKAREGRYREWSFRSSDPALVQPYFRQEQTERVVCDALREHVRFSQLNLVEGDTEAAWSALGQFDLIFCRNVLIYFDAASVAQVERRLFDALAPGGWLVTGPSDPPFGHSSQLESVLHEHGVCYRRRALHESVPKPARRSAPLPLPLSIASAPSLPAPSVPPPRRADPDRSYRDATGALERADYPRVLAIARNEPEDLRLSVLGVRATWNQSGAAAAEHACAHALAAHPLSSELHYFHAMTLMDCKRLSDALRAVRHALYLDRSLTIAHFAHGAILERLHDLDGARRAYRNTYEACTRHLPDEALALGDGIVAQGLKNAAAHALQELAKRCSA